MTQKVANAGRSSTGASCYRDCLPISFPQHLLDEASAGWERNGKHDLPPRNLHSDSFSLYSIQLLVSPLQGGEWRRPCGFKRAGG